MMPPLDAPCHGETQVPAVTPLRGRLPSIGPRFAGLRRQLFARPCSLSSADGGGRLRLRHAARPPAGGPWVRLASEALALYLRPESHDRSRALGERQWWDYPAASRPLAWSLANDELLGALGGVIGGAFLADAVLDELPRIGGDTFACQIEWRGLRFDTRLHLADEMLEQIAAIERWRTDDTAPRPDFTGLPASIDAVLCGPRMPVSELRDLRTGDVLLLDTRERCADRFVVTAARQRYAARLEGGRRLRLTSPSPTPEPTMSDDIKTAADTPHKPALALDEAELDLSFDLGRLPSSLGELAALQPGYVFELPNRLDHSRVTIRANGRAVGRGELVAVGDSLGVLLLELSGDGLQ